MSAAGFTIRECTSAEDFLQCIELERTVWKDDDIDIMPVRLYMISKSCQAPTIGAFDSHGRLVGFVHTSLALVGRQVAYHSHMAAVVEELRHQDLGYRIKLAQRERAIEAGIPLIFWTFDPLQSRNAHFNVNKLGVVVRRYEVNYYGEGVSTVFDPDVPSDRIFAEWWVGSERVKAVLAGERPEVASEVRVSVPANVDAIRADSLEEHVNWRLRVREEFQCALSRGLIVTGFERDVEAATGSYVFGQDEPQFDFDAYERVTTLG